MSVCMYVRTYVHMYVCMYVCIYTYIYVTITLYQFSATRNTIAAFGAVSSAFRSSLSYFNSPLPIILLGRCTVVLAEALSPGKKKKKKTWFDTRWCSPSYVCWFIIP